MDAISFLFRVQGKILCSNLSNRHAIRGIIKNYVDFSDNL